MKAVAKDVCADGLPAIPGEPVERKVPGPGESIHDERPTWAGYSLTWSDED